MFTGIVLNPYDQKIEEVQTHHHLNHLKQRLRSSNDGFKKENESSVDHKAGNTKSELDLQIKDFFLSRIALQQFCMC